MGTRRTATQPLSLSAGNHDLGRLLWGGTTGRTPTARSKIDRGTLAVLGMLMYCGKCTRFHADIHVPCSNKVRRI
jgi:hypothetical protein